MSKSRIDIAEHAYSSRITYTAPKGTTATSQLKCPEITPEAKLYDIKYALFARSFRLCKF